MGRVAAPSAAGEPRMIDQDRTADQRSIGRLAATLENAWVRADAGAYASRFARDGTFTNVLGMYFCGHESFRERHHTGPCSRAAR